MNILNINGRLVGNDYPPLVIAEIGINHGGSLDIAIEMADAALLSGAEVIKHQTHIVEDEMSFEAKNIMPSNGGGISIYDIMQRSALNKEDEFKLMQHVIAKNGIFISTPFSRAAVLRLQEFDIPAIKIGSGECSNYPLIKEVAKLGKPVILSTGMNSIKSINVSVNILRQHNVPYALLHCTNIYPTPPELVRLGGLQELEKYFPDAVIGLSDHTINNYTCFGAVALGASILEKHFTDSMLRDGPDIACSMDPEALVDLIKGSHEIFLARGGQKGAVDEERGTIEFAFASVVAIKDIYPGELLTNENLWVKRPGTGEYGSADFESLLGKKAIKFIKAGYQLKKSQVQESE